MTRERCACTTRSNVAAVLVLATFLALDARAVTLRVRVDWDPAPPPGQDSSVALNSTTAIRPGDATGEGQAFLVEASDQSLFVPIVARLASPSPAGYLGEEIEVRVPFYAADTIGLVLAPSKLDPNTTEAVRGVMQPVLASLRSDSVIKLYQRCHAIVRARLAELREPDDVSVWDVRAAYRYLEVAFLLTKISEIYVAPDALRVRESLAQWIGHPTASRRVEAAGPLERTQKLVADLEQVEVPQYTRLYKEINKLDCPQRLPRLDQFRATIRDIPQEERRSAIYNGLGVDPAQIQLAINQCAATLAGASADPTRSAALLQTAIEASARARELTKAPGYQEQLARDVGFMSSRLEAIRGASAPM